MDARDPRQEQEPRPEDYDVGCCWHTHAACTGPAGAGGKGSGQVGIWRVTQLKQCKRGGPGGGVKGKVGKTWLNKGDWQRVDAKMNTARFRKMMRHKVTRRL